MLLIEVMCIPHALIMLVRTHMDIYTFGVCWILLHAAVQSDHGRDWWIGGRPRIGSKPLYSLTTTSIQQFQLVEFPY